MAWLKPYFTLEPMKKNKAKRERPPTEREKREARDILVNVLQAREAHAIRRAVRWGLYGLAIGVFVGAVGALVAVGYIPGLADYLRP